MMSILLKMPWYATHLITINQRHMMFSAVMRMVDALQRKIRNIDMQSGPPQMMQLNEQLFSRLVKAAMRCHGFTPVQKESIAFAGNVPSEELSDYNVPPFAAKWKHTYALVPKPGVPADMVMVRFPSSVLLAPNLQGLKSH